MSQPGRYGDRAAAHNNDGASGSQQQLQPAMIPTTIPPRVANALPAIRLLIIGWLQSFLDAMDVYQNIPGITAPYDEYPLPQGFPFPSPIHRARNRSNLPLLETLPLFPLLSQNRRADSLNPRTAVEIKASDMDVVLVQSDIFRWVEELDRNNQIYWSIKVYLVIHRMKEMVSPLKWELRWGRITLGAFELSRSMHPAMFRRISAQFVLKTLIFSVEQCNTIILTRKPNGMGEFKQGPKL